MLTSHRKRRAKALNIAFLTDLIEVSRQPPPYARLPPLKPVRAGRFLAEGTRRGSSFQPDGSVRGYRFHARRGAEQRLARMAGRHYFMTLPVIVKQEYMTRPRRNVDFDFYFVSFSIGVTLILSRRS